MSGTFVSRLVGQVLVAAVLLVGVVGWVGAPGASAGGVDSCRVSVDGADLTVSWDVSGLKRAQVRTVEQGWLATVHVSEGISITLSGQDPGLSYFIRVKTWDGRQFDLDCRDVDPPAETVHCWNRRVSTPEEGTVVLVEASGDNVSRTTYRSSGRWVATVDGAPEIETLPGNVGNLTATVFWRDGTQVTTECLRHYHWRTYTAKGPACVVDRVGHELIDKFRFYGFDGGSGNLRDSDGWLRTIDDSFAPITSLKDAGDYYIVYRPDGGPRTKVECRDERPSDLFDQLIEIPATGEAPNPKGWPDPGNPTVHRNGDYEARILSPREDVVFGDWEYVVRIKNQRTDETTYMDAGSGGVTWSPHISADGNTLLLKVVQREVLYAVEVDLEHNTTRWHIINDGR